MTRTGERGAGLIGTVAGFVAFLSMMLTGVQVLFDLYATSMVTAAAVDAAGQVAGVDAGDDRCAAVDAAEARFVAALGDYGRAGHARLEWTCSDPDAVAVRVRARHPSVLPRALAGLLVLGEVDRTVTVRVERPR